MVNLATDTKMDTLFYSICLRGIDLKPHIYTLSITHFALRFCGRVFKTRSITHVTGTDIYIYIRTYVQDGMEIRRNLFMNLLAHKRNGFLPIDIKHYLSRITERCIQYNL
jgi:hypothetical protein